MGFFWPKAVKVDIGPLGRLGRVVHWASMVLALGWLALGWSMIASDPDGQYAPVEWILVGLAGASYCGGRGLRYVLAGE